MPGERDYVETVDTADVAVRHTAALDVGFGGADAGAVHMTAVGDTAAAGAPANAAAVEATAEVATSPGIAVVTGGSAAAVAGDAACSFG